MKIKKYKRKIILVLFIIAFFSWIYMGPDFLSKHFHELGEAYIEKIGRVNDDDNINSIAYVVDKFELRPNSYREIVEISGFAFKELKPNIKNREIFILLESINKKNNNYIIKTQLMQRPDVLTLYLPGKKIEDYMDVGYYAKFSSIGIKNGIYRVNIMVKENNIKYYRYINFEFKKDKGMINILPK
ncbi:hypothetical protein [Leptotrichia shahii]|jgi:hypothetical protein|uniref:hypothetical protein n=1 Tax=Leptotrichia shahii TaxID=157691 RepID=UPI0028D0AE5E|nr:hypothetical protein [Leptotrichia shahii]